MKTPRILTGRVGLLLLAVLSGTFAFPSNACADDVMKQTQPPADIEATKLRLQKIADAINAYIGDKKRTPPVAGGAAATDKHLSWRVFILPYLGEEEKQLYLKFKLDEPWDSSHNLQLVKEIPKVYRSSSIVSPMGYTNFTAIRTDDGPFSDAGKELRKDFITTDFGHVRCLAEVNDAHAVVWTKPEDIVYDKANPLTPFDRYRRTGFLLASLEDPPALIPMDVDPLNLDSLVHNPHNIEFNVESMKPREQPYARPEETIAFLQKLGGVIFLNPSGKLQLLDFGDRGDFISDETLFVLMKLGGLDELREINLSASATTNESLLPLLKGIKHPDKIERLELSATGIDDKLFIHLREMKSLKVLRLSFTAVSDRLLLALPPIQTLNELDISRTAVTTKGIANLHKFENLTSLNLGAKGITPAARAALRKKLPNCFIFPFE